MTFKRFSCNYCPKDYPTSKNLARHVKIHTGELFYCSKCPEGFSKETEQRRHFKTHLGDDVASYDCNVCKKKYVRHADLKKHFLKCRPNLRKSQPIMPKKKTETPKKKTETIQCQFCEKEFTDFEEWKDHEEAEAEDLELEKGTNSPSQSNFIDNEMELNEDDDVPLIIDESHEEAKTSVKIDLPKQSWSEILLADTPSKDPSNDVNDFNGLAKWIAGKTSTHAEQNKASFIPLQEDNEPKTSTANLPDNIKDKLKEVQDITNKIDVSLDEDLIQIQENKTYEIYSPNQSMGNKSEVLYVNEPDVKGDSKQKKTPHQCKVCNNFYPSSYSLKAHSFSHLKTNFCDTCQRGFHDAHSLKRHNRSITHKTKLKEKSLNFSTNSSPPMVHKTNSKFSEEQLQFLNNYFDESEHLQTNHEQEICQKTNLSLRSVKMWFINQRRYHSKTYNKVSNSPMVLQNIISSQSVIVENPSENSSENLPKPKPIEIISDNSPQPKTINTISENSPQPIDQSDKDDVDYLYIDVTEAQRSPSPEITEISPVSSSSNHINDLNILQEKAKRLEAVEGMFGVMAQQVSATMMMMQQFSNVLYQNGNGSLPPIQHTFQPQNNAFNAFQPQNNALQHQSNSFNFNSGYPTSSTPFGYNNFNSSYPITSWDTSAQMSNSYSSSSPMPQYTNNSSTYPNSGGQFGGFHQKNTRVYNAVSEKTVYNDPRKVTSNEVTLDNSITSIEGSLNNSISNCEAATQEIHVQTLEGNNQSISQSPLISNPQTDDSVPMDLSIK